MREVSYAIRAIRIKDGVTKFWCAYHTNPFWWSEDIANAASYDTVSAAHMELRGNLSNIESTGSYCLDIVPVQS